MKLGKKVLSLFIATLLIVTLFAGCFGSGTVSNTILADSTSDILEGFIPGEYGGVELDSMEDLVNYYIEVYNNTKTDTAEYIDEDGNTVTRYALLGDEALDVGAIYVDGKENSLVENLVPGIVNTLFKPSTYGLPPCLNSDPNEDVNKQGTSLRESLLSTDDIIAATVKDNEDGTITMVLQPDVVEMAHIGLDSQGKTFNVLGDLDQDVIDSFGLLTWSEGTTDENCRLTYENGTATVIIDTETGRIIKGDYLVNIDVSVIHANVSVLKDRSAYVTIQYRMTYPASDEYIESKGLTKVAS